MGSAIGSIITSAVGGISNAVGTRAQGEASLKNNDYEQNQAQHNADIASIAAKVALQKGRQQEFQSQQKYGSLVGQQKTAYGASGVVANSGSAAAAIAQTRALGEYDAAVIKNNAYREALGYRSQRTQALQRKQMLEAGREALWVGGIANIFGASANTGGDIIGQIGAMQSKKE
jgi:hypothetical protein